MQDLQISSENNPTLPIATLARQFNVDRSILRRRIEGIESPSSRRGLNTKLSEAEEKEFLSSLNNLMTLIFLYQKIGLQRRRNNVLKAKNQSVIVEGIPSRHAGLTDFILRHDLDIYKAKVRDTEETNSRKVTRN